MTYYDEARAARELLHMSDMRHTRSIVDPCGISTFGDGGGISLNEDDELWHEISQSWMTLQVAAYIAAKDEEHHCWLVMMMLLSVNTYGSIADLPTIPKINHPPGLPLLKQEAVSPDRAGSSGPGGTFVIHSFLKLSQQLSVTEKHNMVMDGLPTLYNNVGGRCSGLVEHDNGHSH